MTTHSTVTRDGKTIQVKNLGWLIRNWQDVESFYFELNPVSQRGNEDGILVANLKGGGEYRSGFASFNLCFSWLNRSVFRGQSFRLFNKETETNWNCKIGNEMWGSIQKLEYKEFWNYFKN